MKRSEPMQVGDVLREVLQQEDMDLRLREVQAAAVWSTVVGEHIALQCGQPFVRNGVLTVRIPSPPLRNELYMQRTRLISAINSVLGHEVLREARFLS